jgi:hypothetical protein
MRLECDVMFLPIPIAVPAQAGTHNHRFRVKSRSGSGYGPPLSRGRRESSEMKSSASPRLRVNQQASDEEFGQ